MCYKLNIIKKKLDIKLSREVTLDISKKWNESYKIIMRDKLRKKFIIHDGPPYANGQIHLGHAINKIAKDVIIRKKIAIGFKVHYIPGWDCHGLPIEIKVGRKKKKNKYRDYVKKQISKQIKGLKKLSCISNWKEHYKTMSRSIVKREIKAFFMLIKNKRVLVGKKNIKYCKDCKSTVSDFEIEKTVDKRKTKLIIYTSKNKRKGIIITNGIDTIKTIRTMINKREVKIINMGKKEIENIKKNLKGKEIIKKIKVIIYKCCRHKTTLKTVRKRQIYIDTKIKENNISNINFFPSYTRKKFIFSVFRRPIWCISRQRTWGTPIPIFIKRSKVIKNKKIEKLVIKNIRNWKKIKLSSKYSRFKKCKDILDVWLDSGLTHYTVLKGKKSSNFPADIYLEGKDQHRGWFNSSYITSIIINKKPPFRNLITHGFAVNKKGEKMSKSLGNTISPKDLVKKYGLEALRFFISTSNYYNDISFSEEKIKNRMFLIKKVKNVINFMYRNTIKKNKSIKNIEVKTTIDRFILMKIEKLKMEIHKIDNRYKSYKSYEVLEKFIIKVISPIYISNIKDRLYVLERNDISRKSCQITMLIILKDILILISPYLPYYSEIVWKDLFKSSLIETILEKRKINISKKEVKSINILLNIKKKYNLVKEENKEKKLLVIKTRYADIIKPIEKEIKFLLHNYKNKVIKNKKEEIELRYIKNVVKCKRCLGFSTRIINKICKRCIDIIEGKNQKRVFF
ncbi:class I tRNA ligase family protein [Candidatus Vidania fulgoroideorum]